MDIDSSFKNNVAQVKLAYNLVDYMQQSGITLTRQGMKWKGLCPFHNEKTPSFTVDENFQNYRCFGCGKHGDLISFVTEYEHLDFWEALNKLAEDKNIVIQDSGEEHHIDYKSLRACIKSAANFFYQHFKKLPEDHPAKREITKDSRKLSLGKMLYGYAPEGRTTLYKKLSDEGFSDDTILATGVCSKAQSSGKIFDFWQGRLMFFITDVSGRPIGFSGRKLYENDQRGKYVNSPDGPLFDKSSALYNIDKAKAKASEDKIIYITEGQFDVASFVESEIPNVVASSGTAFTEKQAMICRRLVTEDGKIVFCFDGDSAGIKAAVHVFENIHSIHTQAYVVVFPEGEDPCDFRVKNGSEELRRYVDSHKIPIVEFMLNNLIKNYDMDDEVDRSRYLDSAASVLKTINHTGLQENYMRRVALDAFLPVDSVRKIVQEAVPYKMRKTVEENVVDESGKNIPLSQEDDDENENRIMALINTDLSYNATARILAIGFLNKSYVPYIVKMKKVFPEDFWGIVDEMESFSSDKPFFVPELFSMTLVVRYIMETNFFPLIHVMKDSDVKEQFVYLRKYLLEKRRSRYSDSIHMKISRVLEDSKNGGVDLLEQALEREEKELLSHNL